MFEDLRPFIVFDQYPPLLSGNDPDHVGGRIRERRYADAREALRQASSLATPRPREVILRALLALPGVRAAVGRRVVVGLRLAPASGTQFAAVECSGITVTLTGAVIGELTSGSTDRMLLSSSLKFKASLGRQAPTQLENGAVSVLSTNSGTESEQAGLTATETTTSEEPLEVRAVP